MVTRIALTHAEIKKLIAHREPYLLISHVTENTVGKKLTAVGIQSLRRVVSPDLQILEGLGQASAVLLRQMPEYKREKLPAFAAMKSVRWYGMPDAQYDLLLNVELRRNRAKFGFVNAVAISNGRTVCSGELMFSFLKGESFD